MLQMIHIAAKIWNPDRDKSFNNMLAAVSNFMPDAAPLISIVQVMY